MKKLVHRLSILVVFSPFVASAFIVDIPAFQNSWGAPRKFVGVNHVNGNRVVDITTDSFPIRVEVLTDDLVKIRYASSNEFRSEYTWSIIDTKWGNVSFTVENPPDGPLLIKAKNIQVKVQKNPVLVSVLDGSGKVLLENQGLFADAQDDDVNKKPGAGPAKRLLLGARFKMFGDDHFYGLGEKFRGPGSTSIDWRGHKRDPGLDAIPFGNRFEGSDGGANGNVMVPFLLGSRGFGLFLDTAYKSYWEFDAGDAWFMKQDCDLDWEAGMPRCEKSELRFYVTTAGTTPKIFTRYTQLTGKPIMPPRWMLGYMQSSYGYRNWGEAHTAAAQLRNDGFPLDALFLDLQWFGGVPGVHYENFNPSEAMFGPFNNCENRRVGSLKWFKTADFDFSNPRENLAQFQTDGINIVPIQEGYIDTCNKSDSSDNNNYTEGRNGGFLAKKDFGFAEPALYANGDDAIDSEFNVIGYFGQVGMVNTASAAARDWFWKKHLEILKDGAATFWTDLGEPERFRWWWKYDNDLFHQDVHNVWDMNRAKMFYDGFTRDLPERRPFILSRSGYAGSQRYGVGIWSADAPARLYWAASQPAAHLSLSISGVPYTMSDIGGFGGTPFSNAEQFTRWLQMESFSSLTRAHGNQSIGNQMNRVVNPALFPEPFKSINKKYLAWREQLVPYLYTTAREAFDTGMPILRALALVYPNDETVRDMGDEYLFGPSILVAPVLNGENNNPDTRRSIYLPEGTWIDLHDGTSYVGPQHLEEFNAPIEKMPLFAKAGAIIPKAPILPSLSDARYEGARTLEIYPDGATPYILYDDDGTSNAYQNEGSSATTAINVSETTSLVTVTVDKMQGSYKTKPSTRNYTLEIYSPRKPKNFSFNDGAPVNIDLAPNGARDATPLNAVYFSALKKVIISVPTDAQDINQKKTWKVNY